MVVVSVVFSVVFAVVRRKFVVFSKNNSFLRHRVVSVSAPGMASEDSSNCQIETLENSMFAECLERILRTGRSESACSRGQRGDAHLVEAYQGNEWEYQNLSDYSPDFIR